MGKTVFSGKEIKQPPPLVPVAKTEEEVLRSYILIAFDTSRYVQERKYAVDALRFFDSEKATDALLHLTHDKTSLIRAEAIMSLDDRKGQRVLDALYELLKNGQDGIVRETAAFTLVVHAIKTSKGEAATIVRALCRAATEDPDPMVRNATVLHLTDIVKDKDISIPIRQFIAAYFSRIAVSNDDKKIRINAINGLGEIGNPASPVKRSAAYGLLVSTMVTPALLAASISRDKDIADAADEARKHVLEWEKTMKLRKESGKP